MVGTDKLNSTVLLGAHYAMMLNSRGDINQIIRNIGRQKDLENIRIYNKTGQIKFSNQPAEVDQRTNIKAEACDICHRTDPPLQKLPLVERTRIFDSPRGHRLLGIISPIFNEPGCATGDCHVHLPDKQILGALDVVVSLTATDAQILRAEKGIIVLAVVLFGVVSTILFICMHRFVNQPIQKLITGTGRISRGDYATPVTVAQADELGQLALAINQMGQKIGQNQVELNRQRDEYQHLFEQVPCLITVQDENYRLLQFNREFAQRFDPQPGDYCYESYKGRKEKCRHCPVEKTFADGQSHYGEETGLNKDGSRTHWIFKTSPIRDSEGRIIAAMEMSLDTTSLKQLEERLTESEKKYHTIFNNIPNPIFILNVDTLAVLDCNASVAAVYGHVREALIGTCFLDLFPAPDRPRYAQQLKTTRAIDQAKQIDREGRTVFVNIRTAPSQYPDQPALLVITSDITKRLEAEQQLIQAGKMATLGEMATGVAHELNQPLSVIKTASSFCIKKLNRCEPIRADIMATMFQKIDNNVDRATKIITHMRQFARKSDMDLEKIQINDIIARALDIFSQQLKLRGIQVNLDLDPQLPLILGDPHRLEQVFINLLVNARDAIEMRWRQQVKGPDGGSITLTSGICANRVRVEVIDTGTGIPAGLRDKVFEPFFTTKEVGKGTGLGLSISYGIVKDCQGEIRVASDGRTGSHFTITFPLAQGTP